MPESFLNRQMALYVFSLIWRKGYYGAYRTPDILRPFLFFFIFFSSFTYERKREKGAKYWGYGRHRSIPSVKLNWEHREPFACSRNFQAWLYNGHATGFDPKVLSRKSIDVFISILRNMSHYFIRMLYQPLDIAKRA
jgi:hypothetical protein